MSVPPPAATLEWRQIDSMSFPYYQLGGARIAITGATQGDIARLVGELMSCDPHAGVHHFAVVDEGQTLLCSETAVECLRRQGEQL